MRTKKTEKRKVISIATCVALGCLIGCDSSPTQPAPTVSGLTVTGASEPLTALGQTVQLTATVRLSDGTTQNQTNQASWASSDASVATVNTTGLATAAGSGVAEIRATYQGVTGSLTISVEVVFSEGSLSIPATFVADLDLGQLGGGANADIQFFLNIFSGGRFLAPVNDTKLARVGTSAPGLQGCAQAELFEEGINFNNLPTGSYVCVRTNQGRLSEVRITALPDTYPGTVEISFRTFETQTNG